MTYHYTYLIERRDSQGNISYRKGGANHLGRRIKQHLDGKVKSTKGYELLRICYTRKLTEAQVARFTHWMRVDAMEGAFHNANSYWEPYWAGGVFL